MNASTRGATRRVGGVTRRVGPATLAIAILAAVPVGAAAQDCPDPVTVDPGDTLAEIANECDVSLGAVVRENPQIDDPDVIHVGQEIDIPGGSDDVDRSEPRPDRPQRPQRARPDRRPDSRGRTVHNVSAGETLAGIADRYGVALQAILSLNPDIENPAIIHVGQTIRLPGERRGARPDRDRSDRTEDQRPDRRDESVSVDPRRGAPGSDVRVRGSGYPANAPVQIGFGPPRSEYQVVAGARTDADGRVNATVAVPTWAEPGNEYLFVVTTPDHDDEAISGPFTVSRKGDEGGRSDEGQIMMLRGRLTSEGVECQAMRTEDGTLYTLVGDTEGFQDGDRVAVKARQVGMSVCMQGTTVEVVDVQPAHRGSGRDRGDDDVRQVHRVTGTLIEGAECHALRADDGTVHALVGHDLSPWSEGDRLWVEGVEADASFCMQGGTTLEVREVESRRR